MLLSDFASGETNYVIFDKKNENHVNRSKKIEDAKVD